jgi:hypothetical protein
MPELKGFLFLTKSIPIYTTTDSNFAYHYAITIPTEICDAFALALFHVRMGLPRFPCENARLSPLPCENRMFVIFHVTNAM